MSVEPPKPKLPPLNALRAFEAAARLGSFKAAADELHVTSGAIAQQIKLLEAWSSGELFIRNARGVELSDLGRSALPAFTSAFDQLSAAVHGLSASATPNLVRIAALPSIAQLWVSPRLPIIRAEMPELQISLTALEQPPNLDRDIFDLTLFFQAAEVSPPPSASVVAEDEIFPVCAPNLAEQLDSVQELQTAPILTDSQWLEDWPRWLNHAAPGLVLSGTSSVHSLYSLALEEAKNGGGVLIGHEPLVRRYLKEGTLVAPFAQRVSSGHVLVLDRNREGSERAQVQQVAELLSA